jgi:tRNA nucleotidyltransferase (CCA-adding enzyme)
MQTDIGSRIPSYATAVMNALEKSGHCGYLVGGSLRDLLLGKAPHDFDMTTDASPEEMLEIFSDFRVIPTGLKHGTLTVLSEGNPIEVTTHRVDGDYKDSRRPESVSFTRRLSDDLSRRDFTVNAMAWHEKTGLVDLFGGQADLQAGIIRAVGDPATRFTEDALRILRAFRFSAQLDFDIEENTLLAAKKTKEGLGRISAERIFSEITRLLISPAAAKGLSALFAAECEKWVFFDTVPCLQRAPLLADLPAEAPLRLAFLLAEESVDRVRALCRCLKAPNAFGDRVCSLITAAARPIPTSLYEARHFVTAHWQEWEGALTMRRALGEDVGQAHTLCRTVAKNGTAVEIRRLAVNGKELQEALSVRPVKTGALLLRLQDLVFADPARNKKKVLMELAAEIVAAESEFCHGK